MNDRIEKQIDLAAPVARVWKALVDHREFGAWFLVNLVEPFEVGKESRGHMTYPGYEHVQWKAVVTRLEPERLFAFTWHPAAIDQGTDYSAETPTVVEFLLEPIPSGTRLTLTETGFDKVPAGRRAEAFRMNERGWTAQMNNIRKYVTDTAP